MGIIRVQVPKAPPPLTKEELEALKRVWTARGKPYRKSNPYVRHPDGMVPRCYWRWYCDFCLRGQNRMYSEADAKEAANLHRLRRHPQTFEMSAK